MNKKSKLKLLIVVFFISLFSLVDQVIAHLPYGCYGADSCPVGTTRYYSCFSYMCYGDHTSQSTCPNCDI